MSGDSPIRSILGYRTLPTTILVVFIYVATFFAILLTDQLPSIPHDGSKKLQGFSLSQARRDLEHIAARPHPYNSHANDAVHDYIRNRLFDIAWGRDHVQVDDDLRSNGSWASQKYGVYFEGTNLLVKIDGTDDDPHAQSEDGSGDGVLFSAHYDSVSTAPGATDDAMGVVTLIQLIQYFSDHRQRKTAIFNINNGEEDWLNGAHAFLQHPWSNLTSSFLNLEGAAAGGRPILFRATSMQPLKAYDDVPHQLRVRHPHANVISSDAFARGFIRSGTDFSVYSGTDRHGPASQGPLLKEGLDVAFYKGRSRYHTKWDGPAYTDGGEKSLWSMIDVARGVGVGLLNPEDITTSGTGVITTNGKEKVSKPGVYFDFFKAAIISFSLKGLLLFNIVTLIVGPILLGLLWTIGAVLNNKSGPPPVPSKPAAPHSPAHTPSPSAGHAGGSTRQPTRSFGSTDPTPPPAGLLARFRHLTVKGVLTIVWKQASFWIALIATGVLQGLLVWGYVALNPFTIHSRPYLVLLSFFSLAYFSIVLVLKVAFPPSTVKHTTEAREKEKTTILLHLHVLSWIALLLSTIAIVKSHIGSFYAITVWYLGVWAASIVGTLQPILVSYQVDKGKKRARRARSSSGSSSSSSSSSSSDSDSEHPRPPRPTSERTPLLFGGANGPKKRKEHSSKAGDEGGAIGWWIAQVLLTVPLLVILVGQVGTLLLDAMSQTLPDGSSAWGVYALTSIIATVLVLPVAPFSPKLHIGLTFLALITFIASTAYLWLVFPFTSIDPLKVFFQQTISLDPADVFPSVHSAPKSLINIARTSDEDKVFTELTGTPAYLDRVLPFLPSSRDKFVNCTTSPAKPGLQTCRWKSAELAPSPGGLDPWVNAAGTLNTTTVSDVSWFKADISRTGWSSARIVVQGRNTRNCRLYFDAPSTSGVRVVRYVVHGGSRGMQSGYPVDQSSGAQEVRLWSRTWGRAWEVDVDWETPLGTGEDEGRLSGRIACEWAEYQSAMVDNGSVGGEEQPRIPALEEALAFVPEWVVVSKAADGLVEASVPFTTF